MKKTFLTPIILFLSVSCAFAQFSMDAEFRARSEYRDGSRILLDDTMTPSFVSSQRTRLVSTYIDDGFEFKFTIQNARIWGQDDERGNVPNLNLAEGYLKYNISDAFSVKVGRQHLVLDDGRIFGLRNWNDIAVSHDLAKVTYQNKGFTIQTGGAYNNQKNIYQEADYTLSYYKYLVFFHANKKFDNGLSVSLLHSTDANQDPNDINRHFERQTTGAYLQFKNSGPFSLQASAYYQYGTHTSGIDQQANLFSVIPAYKVNDKVKLFAGMNHLSGNDQTEVNPTVNRSFNKLFGDGHRYYGLMDYFLNVESNTQGAGVNEMMAGIYYTFKPGTELEVSYHGFNVAGALVDPNETALTTANGKYGDEIDLQLKHKINKYLSIRFAYATMFATPTMEIIKGGDSNRYQQWALVMLSAKPNLFKFNKK